MKSYYCVLAFYLTSKFHDDSVNTFEFMGGGGFWSPPQVQELQTEKVQEK